MMVELQGAPGTLHSKNGPSRQAPEQPSPGAMLLSSHCSAPFSLPSPQYSSFTQALLGIGQLHPTSSWQVAEQPSPGMLPPSSQVSPWLTTPSPQREVCTGVHGWLGTAQANPASTWHWSEQPSPGPALPSSHASRPVTLPSPQTMVVIQGAPGVGQT